MLPRQDLMSDPLTMLMVARGDGRVLRREYPRERG